MIEAPFKVQGLITCDNLLCPKYISSGASRFVSTVRKNVVLVGVFWADCNATRDHDARFAPPCKKSSGPVNRFSEMPGPVRCPITVTVLVTRSHTFTRSSITEPVIQRTIIRSICQVSIQRCEWGEASSDTLSVICEFHIGMTIDYTTRLDLTHSCPNRCYSSPASVRDFTDFHFWLHRLMPSWHSRTMVLPSWKD